MGVPQELVFDDGTRVEDIEWIIVKARNYMEMVVPDKFDEGMDALCKNNHETCSWWALMGHCESNSDCE
jgi:hypothetical protein